MPTEFILPPGESFLKFLVVFKKRTDGGLDHYMNLHGNYDQENEYLSAYGFKSWDEVYASGPNQYEGFAACQMRPKAEIVMNEKGKNLYLFADYSSPPEEWKFALRHIPFSLPEWIHIGELKKECLRIFPLWAENHLLKGKTGICGPGAAKIALGRCVVTQTGGTCWGYQQSTVIQQGRPYHTFLHDKSRGFIYGHARVYDDSTGECFGSRSMIEAHARSRVILHPGPDGLLSRFTVFGPDARVFKTKSKTITNPLIPVCEKDLEPVSFEPLPTRTKFWEPEIQGRKQPFRAPNQPFGLPVE